MRRWRWVSAVVAGAMAGVGLGVFASTPALADDKCQVIVENICTGDHAGKYKLDVENDVGADARFCVKSETSLTYPPGDSGEHTQRHCSGKLHARDTTTLYIDAKPGDKIYLDFEVYGEHTHNDYEMTGGHQCTATGVTAGGKVDCHIPANQAGFTFSPSPMAPYSMDHANVASEPGMEPGMNLLNLLAWCVSAAAVVGFMVTGMGMALQLRRGEPGEFSEHFRGFILVGVACILGATAGPIVEFLHVV